MATVEPHQLTASGAQPHEQQHQVSPQQALSLLTPDQLRSMIQRARGLQKDGHTEQTSPELARIQGILLYYQSYHRAQTYQQQTYLAHQRNRAAEYSPPTVNGWAHSSHDGKSEGTNGGAESALEATPIDPSIMALLDGPVPPEPEANQPVIFSPEQLNTLRHQIHAFKLISRGLPLPAHIQQGAYAPEEAARGLEATIEQAGRTTMDRLVDSAVRTHVGALGSRDNHESGEDVEMRDASEDGAVTSDPRGAETLPFTHLRRPARPTLPLHSTKQQRLLMPTTAPAGLDPLQLVAERNHFVNARISQRIRELEALPITIGDAGGPAFRASELDNDPSSSEAASNAKIRTLIELKSLHLREKQRQLRQDVISTYTRSSFINQSQTRAALTKLRQQTVRDARTTEMLEKRQREERLRKSKQKQLDYLQSIVTHGREMLAARKQAAQNSQRFGRQVMKFHADWEKEEQRRVEKLSKERLKALKNDDEEAYMKLVDTAKDTRITHLLRQTNQYLESLAQAVMAQQRAGGGIATDEFSVSEATFGAARLDADAPDTAEDKGKIDYFAVAHRITEKIDKQPDLLVGGQLKDYQIKGLQWMVSLYNNKLNGILADEMGLGKTIQTISLVAYLIERKRQPGPYLIIVPLSTLTNWTIEFQKWAPSVTVIVYKGAPNVRRQIQGQIRQGGYQVLLTTYEYIIKDRPVLSKVRWLHMIIDEGHRMKNTQSRLSMTLTSYYISKYRLILTGTPLQNNLPELWALLNFVLPTIFNSSESFADWFSRPFANTGGEKLEINEEEALLVIRGLHKVLRPFLLRRLKKDVESELPDKTEKIIKCRMSALQQRLYDWMKNYKALLTVAGDGKARAAGGKGVNNTMMQLRKICNHPFVFDAVEGDINPTRALDEKVWRVAGKFELLDRMLPKLFKTGHRVLLFYQMTEIMTIMEDYCRYRTYPYLRLDGMTKSDERAELLRKFNAPDSPYALFILSTRAGGLGLNLQTADTVIIFDSDWNPHADLQAQDRAHRIGQKKVVSVFRLITEKSVEEHMLSRARDKLDMDGKVIQAGRFDQKTSAKESEELLRMLLEADAADDQEESVDMTNDELNGILARGDEEEEIFRRMDEEREKEEEAAWRAQGGRGPRPERLMQDSELPPEYINSRPPNAPPEEVLPTGRGQRVKGTVHYSDGLTDEQFVRALEDEGTDLMEVVEKKRQRKERRAANQAAKAAGLFGTAESSARATPDTPFDTNAHSTDPGASRAISQQRTEENDMDEPSRVASPAAAAEPVVIVLPKRKDKRKREEEASPSLQSGEGDEDAHIAKRQKKKKKDKQAEKPEKQPGKRGRKPDPNKERMKQLFFDCFNVVQGCIADDGHQRCYLFNEFPDKKVYADYYQMIAKPICLSTIRKRIYNGYYKTVTAFRDEFRLMFDNARTYNQPGSEVYQDAEELDKEFTQAYNRLLAGTDLPGAAGGAAEAEEKMADASQTPDDTDAMEVDPPAPPPPPPPQPAKLVLKFKGSRLTA